MRTVECFRNVYYLVTIKDESDNDDMENITQLINDACKHEKCFAGIYVNDTCTRAFRTEVLRNDKKVKIYYTSNLENITEIFKECYEEEKAKDLMEFLESKGVSDLSSVSRKSDEEYRELGFDKDNQDRSGEEREVQQRLLGFLEEFGDSDFVKNKYGENVFEFSVFTKKDD
ncbi:21685_t:CDS:1 [Racocetra persica]|uniref:21685_t:CDS:1 n=1 Tax=Racocetra persica TaxID=160502 RepID=A0ACA9LZG0_9GLOM|nr:21685_t:CDS:1 [Racocetra persica]